MDTTLSPPAGQLLDGRYRIDAQLARGGMATVYLATDTRLDRTVALKIARPELAVDDEFVRRFIGEARSAARLSSPHVVAVYDQGSDGRLHYLAMEYVAGQTLRELLTERGRLSPGKALEIIDGVLSGLEVAHESGIVHRDVKPENVLLTRNNVVKVADFGLARAAAAAGHTKAGMIIGTAAYLAPEQVSASVSDTRTDVYAVGIMLFEMLTGRQPHTGDTPLAVAYKHVNETVPPPSSLVPGLPGAVDALVALATSRNPDLRPADAGHFLEAVTTVRRGLPAAAQPGGPAVGAVRGPVPLPAGQEPQSRWDTGPGLAGWDSGGSAAGDWDSGARPSGHSSGSWDSGAEAPGDWSAGNPPGGTPAAGPETGDSRAEALSGVVLPDSAGQHDPARRDPARHSAGPHDSAQYGAGLHDPAQHAAGPHNAAWQDDASWPDDATAARPASGAAGPDNRQDAMFGLAALGFGSAAAGPASPGRRSEFGSGQGAAGAYSGDRGMNHTLIVPAVDDGGEFGHDRRGRGRGRDDRGPREPLLQRWLFSRRLLYVIAVIILVAAAWLGIGWAIKGQYAAVPHVSGMTVSAARTDLRSLGFAVRAGAAEHSSIVPAGRIIRTQPGGGARAAHGATITIISSLGPAYAQVPPVTGIPAASAEAALRQAGLTWVTTAPATSTTISAGTVISTRPVAGTRWPKAKPVAITVSAGPPLPSFSGVTVSAAQATAGAGGYSINPVQDARGTAPQGTIVRQSPAPGTAISPHEVVTVYVSPGPPPVQVPNVDGLPAAAAVARLEHAGFKVTVNAGLGGRVSSYSPATPQPAGTTITINVGFTLP
jgi:beta-lactam-binding protein with PASTA domain